jgi:hypothetical protein
MSDFIDRYLEELRGHLAGSDPATVQDAVADAEEHLQSAREQAFAANPGRPEAEVAAAILEEYGKPEEVAKAYRDIERRLPPPFAMQRAAEERNPAQRFLGVLGDPRAYASLFFMLFSMITGIIYFTWAVTGISLSVGLMVTILGLPFFGLFVFSVQGLSLVEGRLIEAMLGIRMPRRPASARRGKGLWGKFKARVSDRRVWTTIFYLILKLPLGVLSFSLFVVLLAYALQLILLPALLYIFGLPIVVIQDVHYFAPLWLIPFLMIAGFLDLVVILHLAKLGARAYGAMAKAMLVKG